MNPAEVLTPFDAAKHAPQLYLQDKPVLADLSVEEQQLVFAIYLEKLLTAERDLIGRFYGSDAYNVYGPEFSGTMDLGVVYMLHRVAPFSVLEVLQQTHPHQRNITLLELGGGDGTNMTAMVNILQTADYTVTATMTGLNELPQHTSLRAIGVDVRNRTLSENLPTEWSATQDAIVSIAHLPWTNLYYCLSEIKRVLKPGGVWINFDGYDSPRSDESREAIFGRSWSMGSSAGSLHRAMANTMFGLKMEWNATLGRLLHGPKNWDKGHPIYEGIAYVKPQAEEAVY